MRWFDKEFVIIEGGANGADTYAREWARAMGVGSITCRAQWRLHGRAAGCMRNQYMLDNLKPDLVIAFPGGPGTAHMVRIAKKAGVAVYEVPYA